MIVREKKGGKMKTLLIFLMINIFILSCSKQQSNVKTEPTERSFKTSCEKVLKCDKKWQSITEKGCEKDLEELGFREKIISCIENASCENLDTKFCVSNAVK